MPNRGYDLKLLADNIKIHRTMLHLTQDQLAEKVGYSKQTVSQIEKAKQNPSLPFLVAFAQLADVTIDRLCGIERNTIVVEGLDRKAMIELELRAKQLRKGK